mmetsp:Transcript_20785/g.67298  ORF Transcript_20785/g.67298 Transcript_20785/m.67298 type:complete len:274 (+) Transcript_20785:611-1432(+)
MALRQSLAAGARLWSPAGRALSWVLTSPNCGENFSPVLTAPTLASSATTRPIRCRRTRPTFRKKPRRPTTCAAPPRAPSTRRATPASSRPPQSTPRLSGKRRWRSLGTATAGSSPGSSSSRRTSPDSRATGHRRQSTTLGQTATCSSRRLAAPASKAQTASSRASSACRYTRLHAKSPNLPSTGSRPRSSTSSSRRRPRVVTSPTTGGTMLRSTTARLGRTRADPLLSSSSRSNGRGRIDFAPVWTQASRVQADYRLICTVRQTSPYATTHAM